MDFIVTKNSLTDLNVFFYKKGMTNIHRPMISMLKIDSSRHAEPFFHIGFKHNMGYSSSNHIISGVMVFEVLEGYPMQSILFTNNDSKVKPYMQSLEELESMDFYCVQKRNEDPFGDFVLKNVKFINTQYNQSTSDFSRKLVATFIAESKENFRIPFFFNHFKSDIYSAHLVRSESEIAAIKKDLDNTWDRLPPEVKKECMNVFEMKDNDDTETIKEMITKVWNKICVDKITGNNKITKNSAQYRMREFIRVYYAYANQLNYYLAKARGDLDFLNFIDISKNTSFIEDGIKEDILFKEYKPNRNLKYVKSHNKPVEEKQIVSVLKKDNHFKDFGYIDMKKEKKTIEELRKPYIK